MGSYNSTAAERSVVGARSHADPGASQTVISAHAAFRCALSRSRRTRHIPSQRSPYRGSLLTRHPRAKENTTLTCGCGHARHGLLTNGDDIGVRLSGMMHQKSPASEKEREALALVTRDLRGQLAASVLQQQVFRDKFFRIEATVIANGVKINQLMVKNGFAALYTGTGPRHDWCKP